MIGILWHIYMATNSYLGHIPLLHTVTGVIRLSSECTVWLVGFTWTPKIRGWFRPHWDVIPMKTFVIGFWKWAYFVCFPGIVYYF